MCDTMQYQPLIAEMQKLRDRFELSKSVGPDHFEPGMMEYLDQSYGEYNEEKGKMLLRFQAAGTNHDIRIEHLESIHIGDAVRIKRERKNSGNPNSFLLLDQEGRELGNLPLALANALAPLYDNGRIKFQKASVSFADPLSKRGRYARQAILFVQLQLKFLIN